MDSLSFIPTEQEHNEDFLPPRPSTSKEQPGAPFQKKFERVTCMFCDKMFGVQQNLDNHLIRIHKQGNTLEHIFFLEGGESSYL